MKILDASNIIAIFGKIDRPDLIDKILRLGHDLAVPHHVINELLDTATRMTVTCMIRKRKMQVLRQNSIADIQKFQRHFPGLGPGECDVMLSYQKLRRLGRTVYCILDDGKARARAADLQIEFTGLLGLLAMLKSKNILNSSEYRIIIELLDDSDFRFPKSAVI